MIAVAIGPAIYFYKNMKPYFKYTFPSLSIDPLEKEIWRKVNYLFILLKLFVIHFSIGFFYKYFSCHMKNQLKYLKRLEI